MRDSLCAPDVIQNGVENADGRQKTPQERSPLKPQDFQDYELRSPSSNAMNARRF